jgi:FkbH-like protein
VSLEAARDADLAEAARHEVPPAALCARLARTCARLGDEGAALRWALRVVEAGDDFAAWSAAAAVVARLPVTDVRRSVRVAVLGSATTAQLVALLRLCARAAGIHLEVYEAGFGQYRQEVLDPGSGMYAFAPDLVLLAVHHGEVALPPMSTDPDADVDAEVARWTSLWDAVAQRCGARVVQHTFALPAEAPLGHLGARLPGARATMLREVNARLGARAGTAVSLVDCERLASWVGKHQWFDARYWHLAKQAVSLRSIPLLARHTVAVFAAELGLSRKCLVLDLDGTLWGGVVGEDGVHGLVLGGGPDGEAFLAFQDYVVALKERGVVLAVCSKNNEADAREVFEQHPEMRLRLDDISLFLATWEPKHEQLRRIAKELDLGLDALVFVDDNPTEREAVRRFLPEVDVVALPADPAGYVESLASYTMFESASFTEEDAKRTELYRGRALLREAESAATSIEDFYTSLDMRAAVGPFAEGDLPRVAQLLGKTNQFNLTTRRHGLADLAAFAADPDVIHRTVRLRDRFVDHGLVGVLIAVAHGEVVEIDTWLLSCRVIGRTVEQEMLSQLAVAAMERGARELVGTYVPTAKNALVADLYERLGFDRHDEEDRGDGVTRWTFDLGRRAVPTNPYITADAG